MAGGRESADGSAAEGGSVSCSCVVSSVRGSWARRVWRQWPLLYIVRQRLSDGGQGRYRASSSGFREGERKALLRLGSRSVWSASASRRYDFAGAAQQSDAERRTP